MQRLKNHRGFLNLLYNLIALLRLYMHVQCIYQLNTVANVAPYVFIYLRYDLSFTKLKT